MSIRTIPIEILNEIISFLAASFDEEPTESIEDGKSISLVSRAFRPIGQALRWRYLVFDLRSAPSLAQHFELYPHLAELVRFIDQRVVFEALHLSKPSTSNFRSLVKRDLRLDAKADWAPPLRLSSREDDRAMHLPSGRYGGSTRNLLSSPIA
ncbi:hypothetical protein JCM5350_000039 [Sporobolomyces pararoseus]